MRIPYKSPMRTRSQFKPCKIGSSRTSGEEQKIHAMAAKFNRRGPLKLLTSNFATFEFSFSALREGSFVLKRLYAFILPLKVMVKYVSSPSSILILELTWSPGFLLDPKNTVTLRRNDKQKGDQMTTLMLLLSFRIFDILNFLTDVLR
jgi:hypothetical protein